MCAPLLRDLRRAKASFDYGIRLGAIEAIMYVRRPPLPQALRIVVMFHFTSLQAFNVLEWIAPLKKGPVCNPKSRTRRIRR